MKRLAGAALALGIIVATACGAGESQSNLGTCRFPGSTAGGYTGYCTEYTGPGYTEQKVKDGCEYGTYSTEPCPAGDGTCTWNVGGDFEYSQIYTSDDGDTSGLKAFCEGNKGTWSQ